MRHEHAPIATILPKARSTRTPVISPALAAAWLREHGEDPAVRTVHRLDKAVGGLMVLARSQKAAASLIDQIAARRVEKEYLAVLRGVPPQEEAVLEDLLFHDSRTNRTFVVTRPRKGVREAKLSYRVLGRAEGESGPLSLVRVKLYICDLMVREKSGDEWPS